MTKLIIAIIFLLIGIPAVSKAQEEDAFKEFANAEKIQMLKAYAKKDATLFQKHLEQLTSKYERLNATDQQKYVWEQWMIKEEYYLMADLYALAGEKEKAIRYLEKSENYDYMDLTTDHDLDNIRKDERFNKFLDSAKIKESKMQAYRQNADKSGVKYEPPAAMPVSVYVQVMRQFKVYYNAHNAEEIDNMFSDTWGDRKKSLYTTKVLDEQMKQYGKLISFKYMGQDEGDRYQAIALFKMVFEKSVHVMGISIHKDHKLGTFRPETSSPYIDKLLAKEL